MIRWQRATANVLRLAAVLAIFVGLVAGAAGAGRAAGGGNGDLPYGEYTCVDGYVWREAYPGDVVCVEPWVRDQAAHDNAEAPYRVDPYGAYGPDTCVQGYVWREADPYDLVCVEPWVRDQTAYDNAMAETRWVATAGAGIEGEAVVEDGGTDLVTDITEAEIGGGAAGAAPALWVSQPVGSAAPAANGALRLAFSGQGFTVGGTVFVGLYRPGNEAGEPEYKYETTADVHGGYAAGSFGLETDLYDCQGDRPVAGVRYVAYAYDWATDAWSAGVDAWACEGMIAGASTSGGDGESEPGFEGSLVAVADQDAGIDVAGEFEPGLEGTLVATADQTVDYGASANDNAGGGQQAAGPRIWLSTYRSDPSAACWVEDGEEICRSSSVADIARFQVNGEGFSSFGAVFVGVYVPGTDTLVAQFDAVTLYGDGIKVGTGYFDCTGGTNVDRYEVQAYDWTTGLWSNTLTIEVCRAVL